MVMKLPLNMLAHMRAATRNLMGQGPAAATEAIQQALSAAGLAPTAASTQAPPMRDINPPPTPAQARAEQPQAAAGPETPAAPPTPAQAAQDFAQDFMARLGVPAG